jgi:hypothetical protein
MHQTESRPETPQLVFWSTRASLENDIPSVTAIVETVVSIPLYWWLAIHFETFFPLLVSIIVAPLVLLRSTKSVAFGIKMFSKWEKKLPQVLTSIRRSDTSHNSNIAIAGRLTATIFAFAGTYFLSPFFVAIGIGPFVSELFAFIYGYGGAVVIVTAILVAAFGRTYSSTLPALPYVAALLGLFASRNGIIVAFGIFATSCLAIAVGASFDKTLHLKRRFQKYGLSGLHPVRLTPA